MSKILCGSVTIFPAGKLDGHACATVRSIDPATTLHRFDQFTNNR
jgi:hypothetical protein